MEVRFSPLTPVTCPARRACDGQRGCRSTQAQHKHKHWLHSHGFQNAAAHAGDSDVLSGSPSSADVTHRQCHHSQ